MTKVKYSLITWSKEDLELHMCKEEVQMKKVIFLIRSTQFHHGPNSNTYYLSFYERKSIPY
jgi:hypothetical protein